MAATNDSPDLEALFDEISDSKKAEAANNSEAKTDQANGNINRIQRVAHEKHANRYQHQRHTEAEEVSGREFAQNKSTCETSNGTEDEIDTGGNTGLFQRQ